jgi:arylsulfatase A-like enzyme
MKKDSVIFLTKDALCASYLPVYGNQYWKGKTPNIDELAEKGTVYSHFYTAAPSSAMSYLTMFTRKYPYQLEIKTYRPLTKPYAGKTLFDEANELGYSCHVVWDFAWINLAYRYSECYGKKTVIHSLDTIQQAVGAHYTHDGYLQNDIEKEEKTLETLKSTIQEIAQTEDKVFLWMHLPHVLRGRNGYGSDIDMFDKVVGIAREFFDDDNIFISADHGNMNGFRGKLCYGFDVYEPATRIPLITPLYNNQHFYDKLVSNIDVFDIIFNRITPERDVIYSDSAYYAQVNRKLLVAQNDYRYIYNKKTKKEELYDVGWDPFESFNLIDDIHYDEDRHVNSISREEYFYPYWDQLPEVRKKMRAYKDSIWREASMKQTLLNRAKDFALYFYRKLYRVKA